MDWTARGYFLHAAYAHGVQEMWLEDAAQEIALEVWRTGRLVRWIAIDVARRYGRHSRRGQSRTTVPIDDVELVGRDIAAETAIASDLLRRVLGEVTPPQRTAILKKLRDEPMGHGERMRIYDARRRLERRGWV